MQPLLKKIVIAGGGSAGWMTAAALSSLLDPKDVSITLVESDEIGAIGVGEATIPDIINFNRILGVREDEFMKATQATFKLGIEFVDWGRKGDTYFHPFGQHGVDMRGIDFHQYWMHSHAAGNERPIQEYSLSAVAAKRNRFALPDPDPRSVLSHVRYAYHFDATLYARFLRRYAEARGVRRVEGKVQQVLQTPDTGFIAGLKLENGQTIDGEFFFDCTGFRALLSEKTLGIPLVDWRHWLPCDSALAVASRHSGPLTPYTRSTAKTAGWQWRIPTQHRTGNGHIYCREYMSDDEAASVLLEGLDGEAIGSPRQLRFTAGRRMEFWSKNCIAIGLSSGFVEPLESTSIHLIMIAVTRLMQLFPFGGVSEAIVNRYNDLSQRELEGIRDFIILHYHLNERDGDFWRQCRTMKIPDSLAQRIALFRDGALAYQAADELFRIDSWVQVMLGQGLVPSSRHAMACLMRPDQLRDALTRMAANIQAAVAKLPRHQAFLDTCCAGTGE